jgi:hypothetical protein
LVDNTIIGSKDSQKGKPQVAVNLGETTLAVGNTFTTTNPISVSKKDKTAARMIGNKITLPEEKKVSSLNMPGTPPSKKRKIFEVAAGANAAAIQKAIDQAVSSRSERAIVHLPSGQYSISQTLVIPAGKDIQFVGDGLTTQLNWKGSEPGPILQLKGPSRAILREMHLVGDGKVEGIVIENCDQPGARVVMQQGNTRGNGKGKEGIGLLTDGLDQAEVSLYNFYHSGCKEVGVRAIGGPGMEAGKKMPGRVAIFGGASSNNTLSYDVQKGAGLSVKDVWYEGAPPRFIHFTEASSGTFTLNGAKTATGRPGPDMAATDPDFAALEIDGFTGKFTLINVIVGTNVVITEKSKSAKVFSMNHGTEEYFKNRSDDTQAVALLSTKYTPGGGAVAIPDQGSADDDFILEMLAQLREEVPRPVFPLKKDLTDVRVHRVMVSNSTIGWHLKAE